MAKKLFPFECACDTLWNVFVHNVSACTQHTPYLPACCLSRHNFMRRPTTATVIKSYSYIFIFYIFITSVRLHLSRFHNSRSFYMKRLLIQRRNRNTQRIVSRSGDGDGGASLFLFLVHLLLLFLHSFRCCRCCAVVIIINIIIHLTKHITEMTEESDKNNKFETKTNTKLI